MADHGRALRAARPVLAGAVVAAGKGGAVGLRSRQHVVTVRRIAGAVDHLALLGKRGLLAEIVAGAVQVGDVLGDDDAFGVLPRALADAVLCIDSRLAVGCLCREIGVPGLCACAGGLRQRLAVPVGSRNAAEIAALARAVACQEEAGVGGLCEGRRWCDGGEREAGCRGEFDECAHGVPPNCSCDAATGSTRSTRHYSASASQGKGDNAKQKRRGKTAALCIVLTRRSAGLLDR